MAGSSPPERAANGGANFRPGVWRAARLFAWLQDAAFYRDLHIAAANLIANSENNTWLDVGCGPGLFDAHRSRERL